MRNEASKVGGRINDDGVIVLNDEETFFCNNKIFLIDLSRF